MAEADLDKLAEVRRYIEDHVQKARDLADKVPEAALNQARVAAEAVCRYLFAEELGKGDPGKLQLNDMLTRLAQANVIPNKIRVPFGTIQAYGNLGSHADSELSRIEAEYVEPCLAALDQVTTWFFGEYARGRAAKVKAVPWKQPLALACESPPVREVAGSPFGFLCTEAGDWLGVGAAGEAHPAVTVRARCAAALLDGGRLVVASFAREVLELRGASWEYRTLEAPALSLARTLRGACVGDAAGGLTLLAGLRRTTGLSGPVTELLACDEELVAIAGGALWATRWPIDGDAAPRRIQLGWRATALFAAPTGVGVIGDESCALVDPVADKVEATSQPLVDGIATVAPLGPRGGFVLLSDAGEVSLLDAGLAEVQKVRLPGGGQPVIGVRVTGAGDVLAWTAAGALYRVTGRGIRQLAGEGVLLAYGDPLADDACHVVCRAPGGVVVRREALA